MILTQGKLHRLVALTEALDEYLLPSDQVDINPSEKQICVYFSARALPLSQLKGFTETLELLGYTVVNPSTSGYDLRLVFIDGFFWDD